MDVSLLSHFFPCLSVGILAVKVILSIIRLFQGKRDPRLIGEAVVSGALFVISILVVFSFKSNETAVEILLSLGTRFLIIYQVGSLTLIKKAVLIFSSKCGFLWQFSSEYQGLRRNLATASEGICSVMTTTLSCLIPYNIGPIEDWKIIILAVFAVEHFVLNGVYLLVLWETSPISWSVRACRVRVSQTRVGRIVLLNIFFCAFAWIAGVASIIFYKEAGAGFIISLWVSDTANSQLSKEDF